MTVSPNVPSFTFGQPQFRNAYLSKTRNAIKDSFRSNEKKFWNVKVSRQFKLITKLRQYSVQLFRI